MAMESMTVRSLGEDRYAVDLRGHELVVDQPVTLGGTDVGPTPTELFIAGLASCIAFYAGRYLARHHVDREGMQVDVSWQLAEGRPARVGTVTITITPPPGLPAEKVPAFLAVSRGCTVHHSLEQPPAVLIDVAEAPAAVA